MKLRATTAQGKASDAEEEQKPARRLRDADRIVRRRERRRVELWSRAIRLGFADSEPPSSNRTCGFPAYGFPCETVVIGSISFS